MLENGKGRRLLALLVGGCVCGAAVLILRVVPEGAQVQSGGRGSLSPQPVGFQSGAVGTQGGQAVNVPAARVVNLGALPQATAAQLAPGHPILRPLNGLTDAQYEALKSEVAKRGKPQLTGASPSPRGANSGILSVGGSAGFFGLDESNCGGCRPPDMALAVGENFAVQMVNSAIIVMDKKGNVQGGFPKGTDTFFGLPGGTYTSDPRGFYDWVNHRFVFVMLTESNPFSGTNTGSLLIAASQTYDPRGGWNLYELQIGGSGICPDYPTLGHDSNNWGPGATRGGFYVGINQFGGGTHCSDATSFTQNYLFLIPKDPVYSGAGFSYWVQFGFSFGGLLVDTLQPANMTDRSNKPPAVFVTNSFNINYGGGQCSASATSCNGLVVWSVTNPFGFLNPTPTNPVFAGVGMGTAHNYGLPPNADEPNGVGGVCAHCVDTGDTRISGQVKYNAGELFGSLETAVSGSVEAEPIWFDVHPVTDINGNITAAEERQEDCFVCGGLSDNGSAYYATLQPDPENNVVMVFEYSTDVAYPGVVFTSRRATYGDSLMNGVGIYLEPGFAFYNQSRWGDYTATAPDLTIAPLPLMWFAGMYADGGGNWGTAIGGARYKFPTDE